MLLYHYFDKKTGPFRNLSDLSEEEAYKVLLSIKAEKPETMCAKRQSAGDQDAGCQKWKAVHPRLPAGCVEEVGVGT